MKDTALAPILGRVPSGVYILTVAGPTGEEATAEASAEESADTPAVEPTGMLASWVVQAGFEPPAVSVAVARKRYVCDWITSGRPFVLNVVAEHDKQLLKHFARGFDPGAPAFEGLVTRPCPRGVPILEAAIGHLECAARGHVDTPDHRVFVAEVVGGELASETPPMLHVRKTGAHY